MVSERLEREAVQYGSVGCDKIEVKNEEVAFQSQYSSGLGSSRCKHGETA